MASVAAVTSVAHVFVLSDVNGNGHLDRFLDDNLLEDGNLHGNGDWLWNVDDFVDGHRDVFVNLEADKNSRCNMMYVLYMILFWDFFCKLSTVKLHYLCKDQTFICDRKAFFTLDYCSVKYVGDIEDRLYF